MGTISSNGIIRLMRGDSFTHPIPINVGTKLNPRMYRLTQNDRLYFGLMEPNQSFEDAVLKKVYDWASPTDSDGNTLLMLAPQDTEKLLVGQYYYMIKLRTFDIFGQESVKTIVPPTLFWLEGNNPEVDTTTEYFEKGTYNVDSVIIEGGEVDDTTSIIVFEGGEIV